MTPSIYRGTVEKVEEKDPKSLFSSTSDTTAGINNARENSAAANQSITPVEPMLEPQESLSQDQMSPMSHEGSSPSDPDTSHSVAAENALPPQQEPELEHGHQVEAVESATTLRQESSPVPETKLPELRRKIAKTFGVQTAYIELTADKLAVRLGEGVKITDHNKERLREPLYQPLFVAKEFFKCNAIYRI